MEAWRQSELVKVPQGCGTPDERQGPAAVLSVTAAAAVAQGGAIGPGRGWGGETSFGCGDVLRSLSGPRSLASTGSIGK